MPIPEINEELRITVMRQLGAKGGKSGKGAAKKRPQSHYDRLARLNRRKGTLRRKAQSGAISL